MELDGFEEARKELERLGILLSSYETIPSYRESNKTPNMMELMSRVAAMNEECRVPQSVYVIEECSELTKELTKERRGKGENSEVCKEACDVLVATLVLLYQRNMSFDEICDYIRGKWERALRRYYLKGEL